MPSTKTIHDLGAVLADLGWNFAEVSSDEARIVGTVHYKAINAIWVLWTLLEGFSKRCPCDVNYHVNRDYNYQITLSVKCLH